MYENEMKSGGEIISKQLMAQWRSGSNNQLKRHQSGSYRKQSAIGVKSANAAWRRHQRISSSSVAQQRSKKQAAAYRRNGIAAAMAEMAGEMAKKWRI
jgi:hypothetical protein